MEELLQLLDAGGASLASAARRLGLSEGQALAHLTTTGRARSIDGQLALTAVQSWGLVRVILRSGGCVAEVMSDLGAARVSGRWWNDEDARVHLHLDTSDIQRAVLTSKVGHASGRTVRMVAFVDAAGEVLFKVMIPKERGDLIPAFKALGGET
jgi:putative heme iron utilization protein